MYGGAKQVTVLRAGTTTHETSRMNKPFPMHQHKDTVTSIDNTRPVWSKGAPRGPQVQSGVRGYLWSKGAQGGGQGGGHERGQEGRGGDSYAQNEWEMWAENHQIGRFQIAKSHLYGSKQKMLAESSISLHLPLPTSSSSSSEFSTNTTRERMCGNSRREGNEECDDGNVAYMDGCSPFCKVELCYTYISIYIYLYIYIHILYIYNIYI